MPILANTYHQFTAVSVLHRLQFSFVRILKIIASCMTNLKGMRVAVTCLYIFPFCATDLASMLVCSDFVVCYMVTICVIT